jgi:hypothetical protein
MNKLIDLIIFVIGVAFLWWVLTQLLVILAVPTMFAQLATLAFIVIAVLTALDSMRSGTWFWRR